MQDFIKIGRRVGEKESEEREIKVRNGREHTQTPVRQAWPQKGTLNT